MSLIDHNKMIGCEIYVELNMIAGGTGLVDRVTNATGPEDAVACMTEQQREDLTNSAQHALRLITFNQVCEFLTLKCYRLI